MGMREEAKPNEGMVQRERMYKGIHILFLKDNKTIINFE